jgi:hypothetical protein
MCCDTSKEAAMKPVFQEILTVAMAKLEEGLAQETGETQRREWDPDAPMESGKCASLPDN